MPHYPVLTSLRLIKLRKSLLRCLGHLQRSLLCKYYSTIKSCNKATINKWDSQQFHLGGCSGRLCHAVKGLRQEASTRDKAPPYPTEASCHSGLLNGTSCWGTIWAGDQTHRQGPLGGRACVGQLALTLNPLGWGPRMLQPSWLRLGPAPHPISPASADVGVHLGEATFTSWRHLFLACPGICTPRLFLY